ncbi:hypothetical protein SAMN04488557_0291 [Hyphomicrobium facile]|uniref:Heme exporter protein D n=1 Tax=Hyphomicrobium facile TaxID=51670 RepID=A0A1I7MUF0_9HYPH|nr:hypothetical protein SAMN04488557_0291 [Hyphomicrobium facile]
MEVSVSDDATPVIFFIASVYAFGIVILYALARAWEQALSTRPSSDNAAGYRNERFPADGSGEPMNRLSRSTSRDDVDH